MLAHKTLQANAPVQSLERARPFYEDILGLTPIGSAEMGVQAYRAGDAVLLVYESAYAGTNKATAFSWPLGEDFDAVVQALQSKGVKFEHYADLPGAKLEGDVHISGEMRIAWFKDPDGNVINIGNYKPD